MDLTTKQQVIIGVVLLCSGAAIGYYALPSKVVEKEHIVYQDKIVEKKVYIKDTTKRNNKLYVRIVTIKPDGTKVVETHILDKDQTIVVNNATIDKTDNKTVDDQKEKTTTYDKQSTILSAGINNSGNYGGQVQRRLLGPFYLGGWAYTDRTYGLNIGLGL